jgi:hypothetical protein
VKVKVPECETERRRIKRRLVHDFVQGIRTDDMGLCVQCLETLEYHEMAWPAVLRALANESASDDAREGFLSVYVSYGDSLRNQVDKDLALADGLRALLPRYNGPAITLYRGKTAWNRQRRTYGLSWSASLDVARSFAESSLFRQSTGGSVLLETLAPPEAQCSTMTATLNKNILLTAADWA